MIPPPFGLPAGERPLLDEVDAKWLPLRMSCACREGDAERESKCLVSCSWLFS